MHRRFLFPLAAGIVGLVAISPILADPPSASAAGTKPKPTKATTSSTSADAASNSGADSGNGSSADPGDGSSADPGNGSSADSGNGSGSGSGKGSGSSGPPNGKGGSNGTPPSSGPGSGAGAGHTSSTTCNAPETNQGPAPQMGEPAQSHDAGPAGTVDVERLSDTELRVAKATPNDGWVEQVASPSGPRVTVKFTRQGQSPTLIRFAASMDQKGTMIHIRVTSCG